MVKKKLQKPENFGGLNEKSANFVIWAIYSF